MARKKRRNKATKKGVVSSKREKLAKEKDTRALVVSRQGAPVRVSVDALALIPEEEVWLASRKSARTRRAYRNDVAHFMKTIMDPENWTTE
jgi:hypothetical protein